MNNIRLSDMDTVAGQTKVANILRSEINTLLGRVVALETRPAKTLVVKPVVKSVKKGHKNG